MYKSPLVSKFQLAAMPTFGQAANRPWRQGYLAMVFTRNPLGQVPGRDETQLQNEMTHFRSF